MREIQRERKKRRHKLRTCRVAVVGFMILLHLSHTHTQPEGGNAIKYAKFYGSANENSKRQSADKSRRSRRRRSRRSKGSAARSAGMFVHKGACQCTSSPPSPAWLWENMSAEARETWLAWRMRNICVRLALPTGIKFAHMHKGKNALKC